ncbi:MAG TPA: peptidoglycan editing factor PgeF [Anaeromyxobacter sp.]
MELVTSPLLAAFRHGFTTRRGGVSGAPFDSLNLGGFVSDDPERVAENWRRLREATGLEFARVRQVHGARSVRASAPTPPVEEADVVVSTEPTVAATVSVADCVPILVADRRTGAVAAVHAGWRGTLERAAAEGVAALRAAGSRPADLVAAVGPSIGPCCYEVSSDLAERFRADMSPEVVLPGARPRLDLWKANLLVLEASGVAPDRVDVLRRCTSCERGLFFSHRRDAGRTGRQVAFIAPRRLPAQAGLP